MKINTDNNINFSGLYISNRLEGYSKRVADNVSKSLCQKTKNGKSYIDEIETLGYDILIIPAEFFEQYTVRLGIIKDMEKQKLPDGGYDWFDAKIIQEAHYDSFSPQEFLDNIKQKTKETKFSFKNFIKIFFD